MYTYQYAHLILKVLFECNQSAIVDQGTMRALDPRHLIGSVTKPPRIFYGVGKTGADSKQISVLIYACTRQLKLSINFVVIFNDLWNRVVLPFVREGTQLLGRHTHAVHTPYGALTEAPGHTA